MKRTYGEALCVLNPDTSSVPDQIKRAKSELLAYLKQASPLPLDLQRHIDPNVWSCFADLNVLMSANYRTLPGSLLRAYHSFTRSTKAALWSKVTTSLGVPEDPRHLSQLPAHFGLVYMVLYQVLEPWPEATLVKYTIGIPPWLEPWCQKWGYPHHHVTVMVIDGCGGTGPASPPVFVPVFT